MVDLSKELHLLKEVQNLLKKTEEAEAKIPNALLIEENIKTQYTNIKTKLKNYIWKIENNTLEVAFVGLEKAGKSTFANAFIGRKLLPSQRDRATYIPTEVRYSKEGKVEVYFYTKEEFLEIFHSMLKDVEYPNWEKISLENITVENFKRHFKSLEKRNKALYEKHQNRLERDILQILEKKEEIEKLLTGEKKIFREEEIENYKKFIIDPYLSRAVKRVIIYSSKLKGLENVVIYDLPGFDSPTFTHISYTIEFLKKADAIVFVREADKPSLKGPEVDVLQKTKEEDGVPIKDKLFFFLTKVDVLDSKDEVEEIKRKFINELKNYNLYLNDDRIFLGSAKAYFERDNKENSSTWQKLQLLGFADDGIERIKQSLVEYNKNVRRKLLKTRVHRFLESEVKPMIEKIKTKVYYLDENIDVVSVSLEEVKRIFFRLKDKLQIEIEQLINQIKREVEENKPLTKELEEKIPLSIEFPSEETLQMIKNRIKSEDYTVGNEMPSAFNKAVRNYLKANIRETFANIILISVEQKIKQAEDKFIQLILQNFEEFTEVSDINGLEKALKEFVSEKLSTYTFKQSGLKALIERFSGDLIDITMIPLTDVDREEKFKVSFRDFISLAAYDENFDITQPLTENPLIYKLLTHHDKNLIISEIGEILKKLKEELGEVVFETIPYGKLLYIVWKWRNEGLKVTEIINRIDEMLIKSNKKNKEQHKSENNKFNNQNYTLEFIQQIRKTLKQPQNYQEVEEEIKKDLDILKELLSTVVLRAIHAERAYVVTVVNYGSALKTLVNSEDFFDFIKNNLHLLLESKYQELEDWKKYKPILENLKQSLNNILQKF